MKDIPEWIDKIFSKRVLAFTLSIFIFTTGIFIIGFFESLELNKELYKDNNLLIEQLSNEYDVLGDAFTVLNYTRNVVIGYQNQIKNLTLELAICKGEC